jgi:phage-related tail protein
MVAHKTVDELREELLRADDDLERLRRETAHLRREIAERREALRDPEELSVALTAAEEQEAIIAWLEARREKLQRQLTGV